MSFMSLPLPAEFTETLDPSVRDIFKYFRYFSSLDSTQRYLIDNELPCPSVCFAKKQTNARGTHARDWTANHFGLYFSFSWYKSIPVSLHELTLFMCIQLMNHLQTHYQATTQLKWPNDIFFHQKNWPVFGLMSKKIVLLLGWASI